MKLIEFQSTNEEFLQRSRDRARQKRIIRELFQSRQMKTAMFNHLSRILDAAQRSDQRMTGFQYAEKF